MPERREEKKKRPDSYLALEKEKERRGWKRAWVRESERGWEEEWPKKKRGV